MRGYWHRPAESEQAFVGPFLRTGDVGYLDSEGFLFLVDRVKDVIICGGYNVYPAQVEDALYRHSDVAEAAVIGVPDAYRGETVKAIIALKAGAAAPSLGDLKLFLADKLSPVEIPKLIQIVDVIPKTAVGKISRKDLRDGERGLGAPPTVHR